MPGDLGTTKGKSKLRPVNTGPNYSGDIGGHRMRVFTCDDLEPYLTTDLPSERSHTQFKFVDHVNDIGALQYPKDQYAHATVPLSILVMSLPLACA